MKRLYFAIITVLLSCAVAFGQMAGDTESLTPFDVNLFVKTRDITRIIKTLNFLVFNLLDEQQRVDIIAERNKFKDKTGIDYFDEKSLRNSGIDTSRPVSFANFEKDNVNNRTDDVMLIFLPVLSEKEFPLKFIELVKKVNAGNPEMNISPVTARYKDVTVYQVRNDLYIASANGYLLIGSTSDIIRRVLDARLSRTGTLILDEKYKDYLAKGKNTSDINAFITKKFIIQQSRPSSGNNDTSGLYSLKDFILSTGELQSGEQNENAIFDSIDYIAAGIDLDGNRFKINAGVKLVKNNLYAERILGFLKTGVHEKSLYVPSSDTTLYMSMDLQYLDNLCKGEIEWCSYYSDFKQQIKTDWGIDIEKDFIPYHSGGINIISLDSGASGGVGDLAIFVPMTDSKKSEELWLKLKKGAQGKYGKIKKFGEEKIGNKRGFWYIGESQMRFFISYDKRGIYAGNSTGLMKSAHTGNTMETAQNTGNYGKVINGNTFFLMNIKKNAFLKMMMQTRVPGNPEVTRGLNRIGEIFLYCEKKDGLISLDFEVEIKQSGKKK